jgi:hypothetical protein
MRSSGSYRAARRWFYGDDGARAPFNPVYHPKVGGVRRASAIAVRENQRDRSEAAEATRWDRFAAELSRLGHLFPKLLGGTPARKHYKRPAEILPAQKALEPKHLHSQAHARLHAEAEAENAKVVALGLIGLAA